MIELVDLDLATPPVLLARPDKRLEPAGAGFLRFCRSALSATCEQEIRDAVAAV